MIHCTVKVIDTVPDRGSCYIKPLLLSVCQIGLYIWPHVSAIKPSAKYSDYK